MTLLTDVSTTHTGAGSAAPHASAGRPARPGRARARAVLGAAAWTIVSLSCAVAAWYAVYRLGNVSERILPSPWTVAEEVWTRRSLLWTESLVTARSTVTGFAAAAVVGTAIGTILAFSKVAAKLAWPLLVISQAVPKVALVPILIIWFGLGTTTHAVLAFSVAVFPVVVNASLGFSDIDEDFVLLGCSMHASRTRLFTHVRLPLAVPKLFAGYKVAMTLATVGAIVGELVAGNQGLGYLAQAASGNLQTELAFAAIVAMSALGVALFYAIALLEHVVLRAWHLDPVSRERT